MLETEELQDVGYSEEGTTRRTQVRDRGGDECDRTLEWCNDAGAARVEEDGAGGYHRQFHAELVEILVGFVLSKELEQVVLDHLSAWSLAVVDPVFFQGFPDVGRKRLRRKLRDGRGRRQ